MKKVLILLMFLLNLVIAYANIDFNLSVEKLEMKNGVVTMMDVKNANPGDTLVYTLKITNNGEEKVTNIMPSIPIPEYTTLIPTLVAPTTSYVVSTDNKNYKKYPYLNNDGSPVSDSMYKSIRWTVDSMKPKEVKTFKFGVSVN